MSLAEIAARNRAKKLEQLQRLRPKIEEAKQTIEVIREAKQGQGQARQAVELMQNLRHVPNFFPTPRALVQRMIDCADLFPGCIVLEPSAGKGDIAKAVWGWGVKERELGAEMLRLTCVELNGALVEHLRKLGPWETLHADFLECFEPSLPTVIFDRVLMNPPFERGIDARHIQHAFSFLKPGGRLVAICGSTTGAKLGPWIEENEGEIEQLPAGSFATSERPTNINTCLLTVTKARR